ncbi:unnamed protein product, partial [marine sediment metagenome]
MIVPALPPLPRQGLDLQASDLDGTFAANAERWGVAGLNIDGSRIGTEVRTTGGMSKKSKDAFNRDDNWEPQDIKPETVQGRWPG